MLRAGFIICFFFLSLFADYNNITLSQLLKKVALLNNINIVYSELNSTKLYTFTINNYITAHDLLQVTQIILKKEGYILKKLNKSFYIVEKEKKFKKHFIYKVKFSNADEILSKLRTLYPFIYKLNNDYILINYSNSSELQYVLQSIKKVDKPIVSYYVSLDIYNVNTEALKQLGINIDNLNINKDQGTILLNKSINTNLLPALITLLQNNQYSHLISSPKLFLAPDTNNTAIFKQVTTLPIILTQTQILQGTNPLVNNVKKIIYKDVGLSLELKFISKSEDGKVKLQLHLTDSNIINYTQDGITSSNREITALIEAPLNTPIFIAGLSKDEIKRKVIGIPILRNIPILKYLFSKKIKETENNTLIITITIKKAFEDENAIQL